MAPGVQPEQIDASEAAFRDFTDILSTSLHAPSPFLQQYRNTCVGMGHFGPPDIHLALGEPDSET
jgi:hypothetical protein